MKFDFDQELIVSIVLGDLSAKDCPGIEVSASYRYDIFREEAVIGLEVSVASVQQMIQGREVISLKFVAESLTTPEKLIWGTYHSLARKMSFKLFEYDPRIGLPLNPGFPDCPLFDPPYINAPYRNYLESEPRIANAEPYKTLTTCPFCQSCIHPAITHSPGVWCGGNVGFAHEDCAPWVKPRH